MTMGRRHDDLTSSFIKAIASVAVGWLSATSWSQTWNEATVLKYARSVQVTLSQAKGLSKIAKAIEEFLPQRERDLKEYFDGQTEFPAVLAKLYGGERLSKDDEALLERLERGKQEILNKYQVRIDGQFTKAVGFLSDRQLFVIAERTKGYDKMVSLARKIKTANEEEWPKVRQYIGSLISEEEHDAVLGKAQNEWESKTGKLVDSRD